MSGRFDLPLETTAASRFLPWILAGLVWLAVVALAIGAVADRALELYGMRARIVTVTLPAVEGGQESEAAMRAALAVLKDVRGITAANPVPDAELETLIQPWLGDVPPSQELPLPRLIDVTLDPLAQLDLAALEERLRSVVPGATIGAEAVSRDRAERAAAFLRAWGATIGLLVLLGALLVTAVVTRLTLNMLLDTVEMLRLMGAADGYIARQFERHTLLHGLRGGLLGFALAVATVLAGAIELQLGPIGWILLACVPVVVALLATLVARITALWRLAQLP